MNHYTKTYSSYSPSGVSELLSNDTTVNSTEHLTVIKVPTPQVTVAAYYNVTCCILTKEIMFYENNGGATTNNSVGEKSCMKMR